MDCLKEALIADIGGTNSRFMLTTVSRQIHEPVSLFDMNIPTKSQPHFHLIIEIVLNAIEAIGLKKPKYAFIALPGPVRYKSETGEISNCGWIENTVSSSQLKDKFGFEEVILLNDFEAVGLAMCIIKEEDLVQISGGKPQNCPKFIIGPGTGLGYCMLAPSKQTNEDSRYLVWPGEGGHQIFCPTNDLEIEFLKFLQKKLNKKFINTEQCFAGQSIPNLYEFLKSKFENESLIEIEIPAENIKSEDIISWGTAKKDPTCTLVVDMLLGMLANEISNQIVRILPFGGVYLVGSLSLSLKDYILENKNEVFLNHFYGRDLYEDILKKAPIFIVKYQELGLLGAYEESNRYFNDHHLLTK